MSPYSPPLPSRFMVGTEKVTAMNSVNFMSVTRRKWCAVVKRMRSDLGSSPGKSLKRKLSFFISKMEMIMVPSA